MKTLVHATLSQLGWSVRRDSGAPLGVRFLRKPNARTRGFIEGRPVTSRVYVGSGPDGREGYMNADVRPLPGVSLVCNAWELSRYAADLEDIYTRHMLEHLTREEAVLALGDWRQALRPGGRLELVVPNLDFHIEQWLRADWSDEADEAAATERDWAFAGFYGWQRQCDPEAPDYERSYWDVHKSGYNRARLTKLLEGCGFADIEVLSDTGPHLHMTAVKPRHD